MASKRRAGWLVGVGVLLLGLLAWWWARGPREEAGPSAAQAEATAPRPSTEPEAPALDGSTRTAAAPSRIRLTPAATSEDATSVNGAFEGKVLSTASGAGVPDAELTFSLQNAAFTARTDREGRFTFAPPQPGTYRLAAVTAPDCFPFAPEWGHSPISLTARPGARVRDLTLFLTPALSTLGKVVDPSGKPVPGAEVRILESRGGELALWPGPTRFTTDAEGRFHFQSREETLLEARHPDFLPTRMRLEGSTVQLSRALTLRLGEKKPDATPPPAPEQITGRVLDPSGTPAPGALVQVSGVRGNDTLQPWPRTTTDAEGRFTLEGLDPGEYRVTATAPGYVASHKPRVRSGSSDVELRLGSGGRLTGTVREARTGAPVNSFTVELSLRQGLGRSPLLTQAVIDPGGRFELQAPQGELSVTVAAYGFGVSDEVRVTVGEAPVNVSVELARGGRLFGKVVDDATRVPLPGARVSVEGMMGSPASALPVLATVTTDARGEFSLEGLAAGLRSVLVEAEGHHGRILSGLEVRPDGSIGPLTVELSATQKGEEPRVELVGIGAVLQPSEDVLVVRQALPGGGAAEAGLGSGDAVLQIDGKDVASLGFEGAVQRIRGVEGSSVRLSVRRAADAQVVEVLVVRRRIRG
ncbi:MAG TPA: carboxypeptidase regulatory-like domain-containing protein [Myxococcaceae bacterium]|nr:carboxypeptidase regulatory-like domain-containing protein [Myxococcaceae bacterium]